MTNAPSSPSTSAVVDPHRDGGFDPQPDVPRLTHAERVRTLVHQSGRATLCTIARDPAGFPFGSLVSVHIDFEGTPWVLVSTMAEHTANATADDRVSMLVTEDAPDGVDPLALGRVTLLGTLAQREPSASTREAFLQRHPGARFYVDFPDFSFWALTVTALRYVGGFGRMSWVDALDYYNATPDPIAPFQAGIVEHMNTDHRSSHVPLLTYFLGRADVTDAVMTGVDRLGCDFDATTENGRYPLRLPFPAPVTTSDGVRSTIVAMLTDARRV
jgi:heme iron utilization protein